MRYRVVIGATTYYVNEAGVAATSGVICTALRKEDKWVGTGKGDDGGQYVALMRPVGADAAVAVEAISEEWVAMMVLKTKLFDESEP